MNATSSIPGVATPAPAATQSNAPAPAPVGANQPRPAKPGKARFGRKSAAAPAPAAAPVAES